MGEKIKLYHSNFLPKHAKRVTDLILWFFKKIHVLKLKCRSNFM